MNLETKDGGWFVDDSYAAIGFDPLKEIKPLTKEEKKKLAQEEIREMAKQLKIAEEIEEEI